MSDSIAAAAPQGAPAPAPAPEAPRSWGRALLAEAPYLAMLLAGFGGVTYAGASEQPNLLYWQIMAPLFGLLCVAAGWNRAAGRGMRLQLVWTQAAHWAAFLAAMLLLFMPSVRGVVNDNATEIGLLLLLGLGTFVAGVHAGSWRIIAVGAVLGASVPAVAVLQQSAMLIVGGGIAAVLVGVVFVLARMRG
ncbi:hypothetical protein [Neoroseomonas soli]|uniref:Uncharacterized protein n=1 Tax=Neoroseomonas soli TaxID=1081025 RepID=A0A9X9X201_9PROT|nr:hypothetical protein [Neoroseomonas soli]MBR0673430.1 hypothetical protein [Neoroseomonas soli]